MRAGQASGNGGTGWTAFGGVSTASARLLAADADNRVYFQPAPDYNGQAAITFFPRCVNFVTSGRRHISKGEDGAHRTDLQRRLELLCGPH